MGHQAGFQEAVVDLYRDKKISVILANEVIDVLLLRIDTEINHGALANVLNMALFPVLEQEIRSHVISLLLAGFAWTLARDVPSGLQRVPMHPRGSVGLPEDFLPTYAESPQRIFLVYLRDLTHPTELFCSVRGNKSRPNPQLGPLERAGAPSAAYGDPVRCGPLTRCARLKKKIPATSVTLAW